MEDQVMNKLPLIGDDAPAFEGLQHRERSDFQKITKGNGSYYFPIQQTSRQFVQQNL